MSYPSCYLFTSRFISRVNPLEINKGCNRWWQIPYYWAGCKLYDLFAGREALEGSYYLSKRKALEAFPMLKKDQLVGAIVYYDGK